MKNTTTSGNKSRGRKEVNKRGMTEITRQIGKQKDTQTNKQMRERVKKVRKDMKNTKSSRKKSRGCKEVNKKGQTDKQKLKQTNKPIRMGDEGKERHEKYKINQKER